MKEKTMTRLPREILNELKDLKEYKRETYAEVIKKLINNNSSRLKDAIKKRSYEKGVFE